MPLWHSTTWSLYVCITCIWGICVRPQSHSTEWFTSIVRARWLSYGRQGIQYPRPPDLSRSAAEHSFNEHRPKCNAFWRNNFISNHVQCPNLATAPAEKWRPRTPVKLPSLHLDHVDCTCRVLEYWRSHQKKISSLRCRVVAEKTNEHVSERLRLLDVLMVKAKLIISVDFCVVGR